MTAVTNSVPHTDRPLATLNPYALALLLVGTAFAVTLGLQQIYNVRPPLFAFFAATAASAWFGGRGAGYLSVAISMPLGLYFYAMARPDHAVHIRDISLFLFFVICAFAGGALKLRWRQAQDGLSAADRALNEKAEALQTANAALHGEMAERRRTEAQLDAMRSELQRVSRLTSMAEMAASIAHEVNQPLTAITTNAGTCLRWLNGKTPNIEEACLAAERVVRDAERAAEVVIRIRGMVRKTLTDRAPIQIQDCLVEVASLLDAQIRAQDVQLKWDIKDNPPPVLGDRIQLQQVIYNLLTNALEALAPVGDRIREIAISVWSADESLEVAIADNGCGFADDIFPRLFDSFVTTKPSGMGLGLAISRGIIEAHGGILKAEAASPSGAKFAFTLPLHGVN